MLNAVERTPQANYRKGIMVEEKIIDRVRRLWALSRSSNQFEAEAAALKAQELSLKYGISELDLEEKKQEYVRNLIKLKNKEPFAIMLMDAVARGNDCRLIILSGEGPGAIAVIGLAHSLEITEFVYAQMEKKFDWLTQLAWDIYVGTDPEYRYKSAFRDGLLRSLDKKLQDNKRAIQGDSYGLIVFDALTAAVKRFYPFLGGGWTGYRPSYGDGTADGRAAGRHLSINPGVTGGAQGVRRLGHG